MSNTNRREPPTGCYLRKPRHHQYKAMEEMAEDELEGFPFRHCNRVSSKRGKIVDNFDDITISEHRGQEWSRKKGD